MKKYLLLAALLALGACTNAGPFVTSISSDGRDGLTLKNARST